MRDQLKAFYLEYVNAYITVAAMSDYKHMTEADTQTCVDMGRRIHEEDVARDKTREQGLHGYVCFYNGARHELRESSQYRAKVAAIRHFKAPRSKEHMVSVVLAERPDGSTVTHTPDF